MALPRLKPFHILFERISLLRVMPLSYEVGRVDPIGALRAQ
jgi:hypothetical protein